MIGKENIILTTIVKYNMKPAHCGSCFGEKIV
jgi:hypothetical protein